MRVLPHYACSLAQQAKEKGAFCPTRIAGEFHFDSDTQGWQVTFDPDTLQRIGYDYDGKKTTVLSGVMLGIVSRYGPPDPKDYPNGTVPFNHVLQID